MFALGPIIPDVSRSDTRVAILEVGRLKLRQKWSSSLASLRVIVLSCRSLSPPIFRASTFSCVCLRLVYLGRIVAPRVQRGRHAGVATVQQTSCELPKRPAKKPDGRRPSEQEGSEPLIGEDDKRAHANRRDVRVTVPRTVSATTIPPRISADVGASTETKTPRQVCNLLRGSHAMGGLKVRCSTV